MAKNIDKETFEKITPLYAEKLAVTRKSGYTYNYEGGFQQGIEATLNAVYGYKYNPDTDKDESVSTRVKDHAEALVFEWEEDDERLNGEYVLNGKRVKVERSWNPQWRELLFWDNALERYSYQESRTVKNETVLDLKQNGLLETYEEPELESLGGLHDDIERVNNGDIS